MHWEEGKAARAMPLFSLVLNIFLLNLTAQSYYQGKQAPRANSIMAANGEEAQP